MMTMNNNKRIKSSTSTQERLLSDTDIITTIRVPTFSDKKIKELDLQSMKEEDLKLLKKEGESKPVAVSSSSYPFPIGHDALSH